MKKYLIIAAIALAVAAVVTIWVQRSRINTLTGERDKYRTNTETLLQEVSRYQTKDSLNAAKVGVLELKLSEFEKYRADDAALRPLYVVLSIPTNGLTLTDVLKIIRFRAKL